VDTSTRTTRKTAYEQQELMSRLTELENSLKEINVILQNYNKNLDVIEERQKNALSELEQKIRKLEEKLSAMENSHLLHQEELLKKVSALLAERLGSLESRSSTSVSSTRKREHTVKPGETLHSIANTYGIKADSIIRANNISNPNLLKAGQKLLIPEK